MKRNIKRLASAFLVIIVLALGVFSIGASAASFGSGAAAIAAEVDMVKTGLIGHKLTFSDADFKSALCVSDFESVTIRKIPSSTEGTLLISGRRVGEGKVIKRKNLGALVFIPASDSTTESSFSFTVDGAGAEEEITCRLRFIDKVNYTPKIELQTSAASTKTQANISLYGALAGEDPEGDELFFMVISYPQHGVFTMIDSGEGKYCYTPNEDYIGEDSFVYVVRDEYGNYSYPAKVALSVTERMCDTVYRDMTEREEYNAAVAMTAMNIMDGRLIGDGKYFMPDDEIGRAEFVVMAMRAAGIRSDSTLTTSYFDDDSDIPEAMKGYIATAQRLGLINGDFDDGKLLFRPNESITKYEAAKIMASILSAEGGDEEEVFAFDEAIPVWARAGVSAMRTLGIFDDGDIESSAQSTTRADAAEFLYKMIGAM